MKRSGIRRTGLTVGLVAMATAAAAQEVPAPVTLNFYGAPGGIEMPSGRAAPDGEASATVSYFDGVARATLSFQFSKRLSGSFRFSEFFGLDYGRYEDYSDRSFDIRFLVFEEGPWMPAVTVGLQDFLGTGISSAEYIAATKGFGDKLTVTAGLGWGRFGTYGDWGDPFGQRSKGFTGRGGQPEAGNWFRGPVAPFAGIEYAPTERWRLKLEYSSDDYDLETSTGMLDHNSPINVGVEYHAKQLGSIGLYYLYGSTVGIKADIALNPKRPLVAYAGSPAPAFVPRTGNPGDWTGAWTADPAAVSGVRARMAARLGEQGLVLEGLRLTATEAVVYVRNWHYQAGAQAIGRTVRVMSAELPPSVQSLVVVPMVSGQPTSSLRFDRGQLEQLDAEPGPVSPMAQQPEIGPALALAAEDRAQVYPRFSWAIRPEIEYSWFDPKTPVVWDMVSVSGQYEVAPGAILRGSIGQRIFTRGKDSDHVSDSELPHVRTDTPNYIKEGDTVLQTLTANWYFKPARDVYARVTAGYLERMFGGVSAELLWKQPDNPLALGIEADYVGQRDYDGGFGFRDYRVTTGHVSAYYDFGYGYEGAVHAGRYLAGDWGATLALGRRFASGVEITAFATKTDVSSDEYGEGSFDKGIRVEIPLSYITGRPSRITGATTLRSIQRDGGQMLKVDGRLYEQVRDYHAGTLDLGWGDLWQ